MAKALELRLTTPSGTVTFDYEGRWSLSRENVTRDTAGPPKVIEARDTWKFTGLRLTSSGGKAALFSEVTALLAKLGGDPAQTVTSAAIVDPASPSPPLMSLGSPYEDFRVKSVGLGEDDDLPSSSLRTVATFALEVSASLRHDSGGGVVNVEQSQSESYQNGLHALEWKTRVTTKAGTDARTAGVVYAAIPLAALDGRHVCVTPGGGTGVDIEAVDCYEPGSWKPTVAVFRSAIRAFGITIGAHTYGGWPTSFSKKTTTTTRSTPSGIETEVELVAVADGEHASDWVNSQAPATSDESQIASDHALNHAEGKWVTRTVSPTLAAPDSPRVSVTITGGARVKRYDSIANGYPALLRRGGFKEWIARVEITVRQRGADLSRADLKFPGTLPEPWVLFENESTESGDPEVEGEVTLSPDQTTWVRGASLVFKSGPKPDFTKSLAKVIRDGTPLVSYLTEGS